jgi:hypothetical protein
MIIRNVFIALNNEVNNLRVKKQDFGHFPNFLIKVTSSSIPKKLILPFGAFAAVEPSHGASLSIRYIYYGIY